MIRPRTLFAASFLCVLAALPLLILPAGAQQSDRAKQIGGKLLCGVGTNRCNCQQILTQCNHVGCTNSTAMLKTLDQKIAAGEPDESIVQGFVLEFGTVVLAEPPKSGFSLLAWWLPTIYLILGLVLVTFVIYKWRKRPVAEAAVAHTGPKIPQELLDRARAQAARETED
jgi:cytochrome c-type biogenesis protein CcmH